MRRVVLCAVIVCGAAFLLPTPSEAQVAISGVVKDSSGAVMPGVLVEASSPALIEKTRSRGQRPIAVASTRWSTSGRARMRSASRSPGSRPCCRANVLLEGDVHCRRSTPNCRLAR